MSTTDSLDVATGDEILAGISLQPSIDALLATAKAMDADIATATDVESVQAIGVAQADLNGQAMVLVTAQIRLMAGAAKVTADHINTAAAFAQDAIATIDDWRKKVAAVTALVDFFAAVVTGNGVKIVECAVKLKNKLPAAAPQKSRPA